jgi:hypothetical protein
MRVKAVIMFIRFIGSKNFYRLSFRPLANLFIYVKLRLNEI